MLLLQEFEFDIHHQPGVQHVVAHYLSHLESGELVEGVPDDLSYADIFRITITPPHPDPKDKWIGEMVQFLDTVLPPKDLMLDEKKRLVVCSRNFCLVEGVLYHKGNDGIWRRGIRQDEKDAVLREAHHGTAGGQYAGDVTARKIWQASLWWPTTQKDVHLYCR